MLHGDHFTADIDLCCSVESANGPTGPRPEAEKCAVSHATLNARRLSGINVQNSCVPFVSWLCLGDII